MDDHGPGERGGIVAGDIVGSVDGRPIERAAALRHELGRHKPGETLHFGMIRAGEARTAAVLLDPLEAHEDDGPAETVRAAGRRGALGFHVLDAEGGGAQVASVDAGSPMADDLEPGDVIVEVNRARVGGGGRGAAAAGGGAAFYGAAAGEAAAGFLYVGIELN